jgi:2C-methyl-D-erythritol 2,4-cyclodiphosphate synthase
MCARIAEVLGVSTGQVNVKAKTAERMGPVGEGRAIEARAVCLLHGAAP